MTKLLASLFGENKPGIIFRCYMAAVLFQFAILSFLSVRLCEASDLPLNVSYWWGVCSSFGAVSLLFRSKVRDWKLGALIGDAASVTAFSYLSYDYLTRKPPIYAGGILAATAVAFLIGGLVYERRGA